MDSLRDSHDEIKCSKSGLFSSSKECQHLHAIGCALCKHEQGTVDENSVCKHFSSETLVKHKLSSEQQTKNNFGLPDIIYEDISDGEVQPDVESFKETVCSFNCNSKPTKRSQLERSHSNSFEVQTLSKLSLEQQTEDSHGLFGTVYEDLSDEEIQLAEESAMYREVHICAGHSELKIENHKVLSNNTIYENVSDDEIQPNGKYLLCRDYSCAGNSELKAENRQGLSNNTIYENVSDEEIQPEKNTTKLLGDTEQSAPWLFSVPPQHGEKGGTVRVAAKNSECLQMESSPIPTVISVRSDSVPSKRVVERTLTVPLLSWKEVSFDLRQRDSLNSISGKNETEHKKMVNPVKDQVYGSDARSGISSLEEATGNADGSLHTRSTQRVTPHGQSSVQETENAFSCNNPDNRSHGHREEGWQTKDKQPFLISPEKLQAFRNALKGSEKFRPKWPQSDTDLSHDDEEKMREPDIVKERRLISHTGQEQGHLAITEHNVEVEMEELEESEVFQMDIDAENRYTPPGSVVHTNIPEFSVPGEPCGNQNLVTPAKHFEHSATAAGMRQVLTNMQDRCSTSMKSVYLETCDEFSHHTRRQGSSESSSSSPPVLEPIYGKESKQPELVKLHQMGTQNTTITLSKEASSLSVLPRQGNRRFSKSSEEAVCHSNSLDSSRHQDQHDTLDATAQNSRNTQEPVSAKLKEKSVTALPHPFDASKHCADHERVDFFDDIYNGAVIPSFSSDSSDDELSEGLDSPLKFSAAHHSSPSSRCDSLSLQHNSNLVDEATPDTSIHSFSTAQPAAQYSLDYLLMETKKNEAVNKEIQTLQEKLQRGILLGGFEAVGENECNSDDDGLSAEHREALEKLKLNYSHIPEVHPGEVVLLATGCGRIFNEALSPLRCGFSPSNNSSLEKEIANIQPAYVSDLICSGVISMTSLSCKESLMRWMFFLSSVHSNGIIALKCVEEIAEMIQWHMETNRPECNTWSPEISDILRIFVNWGAKPEKVIFDQSVVCNINQLSEVLDEGHSVPQPKVTYRNIEAVLRVLSSCLQA
ncbi:uncharacterized protein LOC112564158 isoform X2 [Pomacea canaliculata]|nr:uncharacterized protein LOC112564158 isoform X2 [Pomacea canaliculata]